MPLAMNTNPFITCAVTGSGGTQERSPHVPRSPEQIAASAIDAAKAGAAVVHCHVREPDTGAPSRRVELYREVAERIRDADTDVVLNFTAGYGFTGIAVALMGRNHPVGIFLASLLFGALYQGGAELDFEFQSITREMVLLIQGMIILFSGALAYMFNPPLARLIASLSAKREAAHG